MGKRETFSHRLECDICYGYVNVITVTEDYCLAYDFAVLSGSMVKRGSLYCCLSCGKIGDFSKYEAHMVKDYYKDSRSVMVEYHYDLDPYVSNLVCSHTVSNSNGWDFIRKNRGCRRYNYPSSNSSNIIDNTEFVTEVD